MKRLLLFVCVMCVCVLSIGCGPTIVKHPDTPMLIMEAKGRVKVAVEKSPGEIIEFGWIDLRPLDGWSISKYDWSRDVYCDDPTCDVVEGE